MLAEARLPQELAGLLGDVFGAGAFLVLALLLVLGWGRLRRATPIGTLLIAAALASAIWAASEVAADLAAGARIWPEVLAPIHIVGWLAVSAIVACSSRVLSRPMLGLGAALALPAGALAVGGPPLGQAAAAQIGTILLATMGILLVIGLYQLSGPGRRWGLKYLCLAVGGLAAYELALAACAMLALPLQAPLQDARVAASGLAVPLLAVAVARNPTWACDLHVSRPVAAGGFVLTAATLFLTGVLLLASFLRHWLGATGDMLAVLLACAGLLLLGTLLLSGRFWSGLRTILNRHFFSYRYDYRDLWLRFIAVMSERRHTGTPTLAERVLAAVADTVDATGAALWLADARDRLCLEAEFNLTAPAEPVADEKRLAAGLKAGDGMLVLTHARAMSDGSGVSPALLAVEHAWLLLPLVHVDRRIGIMVLGRRRVERSLEWEDRALLRTLGRAAASYLAEERAERALHEVRAYEGYSRRTAHVVHDLKHLAGTLTLLHANALRHGGNPAFLADLLDGLASVAAQAQGLVGRTRTVRPGGTASTDVAKLLTRLLEERSEQPPRLLTPLPSLYVPVPDTELASALNHLIDNGFEAVADGGEVRVSLREAGPLAIIEVSDSGHGMTRAFVREQLWQPFVTTKRDGLGLGVASARTVAERAGGRLEIDTAPRRGTTMRLLLPRSEVAA